MAQSGMGRKQQASRLDTYYMKILGRGILLISFHLGAISAWDNTSNTEFSLEVSISYVCTV
jgi:hypothetical protein